MGLVDDYGAYIGRQVAAGRGARARRLVRLGLAYEGARLRLRPDPRTPKALVRLNRLAVRAVADALARPSRCVWVNLFAPVELLQAFGLRPLSIECFSSFMGGFRVEGQFLADAERAGYADTLCAYHKNFLGAAVDGVLRPPLAALTTTLACDGNVNTFRALGERFGCPTLVIDVPYEYSEANERYVVRQLEEAASSLARLTGRPFDTAALSRALESENRARDLHEEALRLGASRDYPSTLTLQMFKLFATHILSGSPEVEAYYRQLVAELRTAPEDPTALRILWVHLQPFHQAALQKYFNYNPRVRFLASDFDADYGDGRLDPARPLESLARKMLLNIYNGPYERKAAAVRALAERLRPDGAIHFNHWGCKQSAGGVALMQRALEGGGVPFLALDGDGLDRRNSPDAQIASRVDAFFEMLEARRGGAAEPALGPRPEGCHPYEGEHARKETPG
ncbi:MAG: 2-hydroxyacyl-CoA dehydratase family protein [Clostridiales Family XIII bacterium]|jgi:benzoyl-CoA reductase/2-hydroxyglutaryl-CoA dehydratase subunit BcrC/BadD/HgdB|nr:2-hydroxyacyl-CoA dehydratase family protein [Clostridiales Family XIII bacterium]